MNHMGLLKCLQGQIEEGMAEAGTSPLTFHVPPGGFVLLMAQASVTGVEGGHAGVRFSLFSKDGTLVKFQEARVPVQDGAHGTVCMTYLTGQLAPYTDAKITIGQPGGGGPLDGENHYSIAVVELEHDLQLGETK